MINEKVNNNLKLGNNQVPYGVNEVSQNAKIQIGIIVFDEKELIVNVSSASILYTVVK